MTSPPAPIDAPLPEEITGIGHNWWTDYRRYPVFSRPWAIGRLRLWGLIVGLWIAIAVMAMVAAERGTGAIVVGIVHLLIVYGMPIVAGPALGVAVRRRHWPRPREGQALLAALAVVVVLTTALQHWGLEPVKQQIAEWLGDVDAQGKRRKVRMAFGFSVIDSASAPASAPAATPERDATEQPEPGDAPLDVAFSMLLTFVLAGGAALATWRRQHLLLEALHGRRQLAAAQAAQREAELRLSVLAAQVEPHFLFNTLAGVRSAVGSDPKRASEMIDRLVEYLRASIPRLRADGGLGHSTLGAQCEIVRAYLGLMQARMPRLAFRVELPPELAGSRFPPLMLISLAENAVKHGVEPKMGPATIVVSAVAEGDRLIVAVRDDGVGFGTASAGSGIGLQNVRERLAQLYGDRAGLELKAAPDGGVVAAIRLPRESA